MSNLSVGERSAPMTRWSTSTTTNPKMKVGRHHHGLCDEISHNTHKTRCIWVIIDKLTKSSHSLTMKMIDALDKLIKIYILEIVRSHGIPVLVTSERDPKFNPRYWASFQQTMDTKLSFSTIFHLQTDG